MQVGMVALTKQNIQRDNNCAEQMFQPFTIGHKNFVIIVSSTNEKTSAILYSQAETTNANITNTFEYFTEILQH